MTVAMVSGIYN